MNEGQTFALRWRGKEQGPYPLEEINRKLDDHEIGMGHEVFYEDEWITLEEFFTRLRKASSPGQPDAPPRVGATVAGSAPPPIIRAVASDAQAARSNTTRFVRTAGSATVVQGDAIRVPLGGEPNAIASRPSSPCNRLVYALLAILFGFAGIHNYYARHWLTGFLQLLLSIATFLLGFGVIAPWLWAVMEAVLVRKDGNGLEMT